MTEVKRKKTVLKLVLLVVALGGLAASWFVLRSTGRLPMFDSADALRDWVAGFGPAAPAVFFGLQVLQVVVSPIPGNVTTMMGGMLFGFWPSFLLSAGAVGVGGIIAFGLARAFGRPLVVRLVGPEITKRYLGALSSRVRIVLFFMFLLPFFPDDALCLIAGLTGISWLYFVLVMILTRPWGLVFSSMVGSGMISMPVWGWAIIIAATAGIAWGSIRWGPALEKRLYERITGSRSEQSE